MNNRHLAWLCFSQFGIGASLMGTVLGGEPIPEPPEEEMEEDDDEEEAGLHGVQKLHDIWEVV